MGGPSGQGASSAPRSQDHLSDLEVAFKFRGEEISRLERENDALRRALAVQADREAGITFWQAVCGAFAELWGRLRRKLKG